MIIFTKKIFNLKTCDNKVVLDLNTRFKNRIKIQLENGRKAILMLKVRKLIRGGEILSDAFNKEMVQVISANEKLSLVYSNDYLLLLKACYHLGNRHVLLQIQKKKIIYYRDRILDNIMFNFGLTVNHILAPFEPESGAYSSLYNNDK